jgi:hypothetical protein
MSGLGLKPSEVQNQSDRLLAEATLDGLERRSKPRHGVVFFFMNTSFE